MSKSIYICSRDILPSNINIKLTHICNRLSPDNISSRPPIIRINKNIAYAITNPTDNIIIKNNSFMLGALYGKSENWHKPQEEYPDGSFALFRNSAELCEVVSDAAGSRTVWYYFNTNIFICSTSQRAIIMYINSIQFNEKVIPWMLSSGSLGPEFSWDKRIKRIPPNSSILLNKREWTMSKNISKIIFKENKLPKAKHKKNLIHRLKETFNNLNLNYDKWYLPLSGGYDSRGILNFLTNVPSNNNYLQTLTWGISSAVDDTETDAFIAKKLASHYQVSHKYYTTDQPNESIEKIFYRFLWLGEGRIDHISGYMDGFNIWKTLYEDGVQGIIRGDEGFGWNEAAISELYIRLSTGSTLCKDISNLKKYREYGIPEQEVPISFQRRDNETIPMWRDRIYHEFRLPIVIASLTDLKLAYVEQISPLLSKDILNYVRQLPDHFRTDKFLFKEIVDDFGLNINYATKDAIANPVNILNSLDAANLLKKELSSKYAKNIFQDNFLNLIKNNIRSYSPKKEINKSSNRAKRLFEITPDLIKNLIRKYILKPKLDYNLIAFRIYIISSMHQLLIEDSNQNNEFTP